MKVQLTGSTEKVTGIVQSFGLRVLSSRGMSHGGAPSHPKGDTITVVEIEEDDLDHITDQVTQWQIRWKVIP